MPAMEQERPVIKLYFDEKSASQETIKQVMYGIEEEGVPCDASPASGSALTLAVEAGRASRLEVGLGVDAVAVALHYSKLEPDAPLFQVHAKEDSERLRSIGANAARLVKKQPFKAL